LTATSHMVSYRCSIHDMTCVLSVEEVNMVSFILHLLLLWQLLTLLTSSISSSLIYVKLL